MMPARPVSRRDSWRALGLALVLTLLPGATPVVGSSGCPAAGAGTGVTLLFDPAPARLVREQVQEVFLLVHAVQPITGIEVHFDFDPAHLRVLRSAVKSEGEAAKLALPEPPRMLPAVVVNSVDNATGRIDFAAERPDGTPTPVSGCFALAVPYLLGVEATDAMGTSIRLIDDEAAGRRTRAVANGREIPVGGMDATYHVVPPRLRGQVQMQGHAAGAAGRSEPLWVWLYSLPVPDVPTPTVTPSLVVAQPDGSFVAEAPQAGEYDVVVRGQTSLRNRRPAVSIGVDDTPRCFGTLLEGDSNSDGVINKADAAIVQHAFASASGDVTFDARADLNRDGAVDVLDFSLLALNAGRGGDQLVTCGP